MTTFATSSTTGATITASEPNDGKIGTTTTAVAVRSISPSMSPRSVMTTMQNVTSPTTTTSTTITSTGTTIAFPIIANTNVAAEAPPVVMPQSVSAPQPTSNQNDHQQQQVNQQTTVLFPWKLHEMLTDALNEHKDDIVSWLPDGTAFKVHNVTEFVENILPSYFKQTKYKSFQRQLNLWGFERIVAGPEKGAYFHPKFIQNQPDLCSTLTRQRAKKAGGAAAGGDGGGGSTTKTLSARASGLMPSSKNSVTVTPHPRTPTLVKNPLATAVGAAGSLPPIVPILSNNSTTPRSSSQSTVKSSKSKPKAVKRKSSTTTKTKTPSATARRGSKKNSRTKPTNVSGKNGAVDANIPPSIATTILPRQVSDSCLDVVNEFMATDPSMTFDGLPTTFYETLPMDLAEFEGFTFHLLENERYEELNHEFKFVPGNVAPTAETTPTVTTTTTESSDPQQSMMPPLPTTPLPSSSVLAAPFDGSQHCSVNNFSSTMSPSSSSSSSSSTSSDQDAYQYDYGTGDDMGDGNAQQLLRELEQGVFGMPKTVFNSMVTEETLAL